MTEQISYDEFLNLVETMVGENDSGVLYVHTADNHLFFLGIKDGVIKTLSSGAKHGMDAIPIITSMSHGTYRRDDSVMEYHSAELPPTDEILALLKAKRPGKVAAAEQAGEDTGGDSLKNRKILCELLHDYLGPISPIICENLASSGIDMGTSSGLEKAIHSMASEIGSEAESAEFIKRATEQLKT